MPDSLLRTLTPLKNKVCSFPYIPTGWQTFIFRTFGRITPERIARILGSDPETVLREARRMGISGPPADAETEALWLSRGYVTLIRDSWHLLDFAQICELLSKSERELAYILKEDDFLHVKLGSFKPDVPPLACLPLDDVQLEKTGRMKERLAVIYSSVEPETVRPFDFAPMFGRLSGIPGEKKKGNGVRLVYSYCSIYGDPFLSDPDYGFSDEMLEAYARAGVTGVWCQAVLYRIAPYPFLPSLSEGWEKRLEGLRKLTERLARHGLDLWLYLNEPRALPSEFFADGLHDAIKGHTRGALTSLCVSSLPVREYLYGTAAFIARQVPLLGGFMTISGSENLTHCCSHTEHPDDCPRCSKRDYADVTAECSNLLYRGAASVNPDFGMIAWTWGWPDGRVSDVIDRLDGNITVSEVSEHGKRKTLNGVETSVSDYSISVVGPGEHALGTWRKAAANGRGICAKTQLNSSWECSTVPMLPVFDTVAKHMCALRREGVDSLILSWTVGGYPSPTFELARIINEDGITDETPALDLFYSRFFPDGCRGKVRDAVRLFCEAFDSFPFHVRVLYKGPQQTGPANPLRLEPTGMSATMTGWPYDDAESWRGIFPADVFEDLLKKLSDRWREGLDILDSIPASGGTVSDVIDCAGAAYCCFRSSYVQFRFNRLRGRADENRDELISLAREERELAIRLANLQGRNPCIGFESTNHYFFTRSSLAEAALSCDEVIDRLSGQERITSPDTASRTASV